jgi:ferritin-like metal-binding protein YciE
MPCSIAIFTRAQLFVHDVRCYHAINKQLSKALKLSFCRLYQLAELVKTAVHEHIPSKIDRLLLGRALVLVVMQLDFFP